VGHILFYFSTHAAASHYLFMLSDKVKKFIDSFIG